MDNRKNLDDEVDKILRDAKAKKAAEEAAKAADAENAGSPAEDIPAPTRVEITAPADKAAKATEPAEPTEHTQPAGDDEPISKPEYNPVSLAEEAGALTVEEEEAEETEEPDGGKKKHKKRKLSTPWKIVIIVLAVIIVVAAVFGIIALVTDDNPITYTTAVVTNSENKLIANWESDEYPGRYAYTFNEDGTYQEYYCNYSFDYEYEATVTHLTLRNPHTGLEEIYKYTISGDTLKLTLVEQYGHEIEDGETTVYHKVDTLNMSDIADLAGDL